MYKAQQLHLDEFRVLRDKIEAFIKSRGSQKWSLGRTTEASTSATSAETVALGR